MKRKISNQFFMNYLIAFLLSVLAALCAVMLLSFGSSVLSRTLTKNNFPASTVMNDDYTKIDASEVVRNGGGVQVIDKNYDVIISEGIDTINKKNLTAAEFTAFLTASERKGLPYHYDIMYNPNGEFWLVVTFPVSIRIDFALAFNKEAASKDMPAVAGALAAVLLFYLLLLGLFALVYSKLTAVRITNPLQKLSEGTRRLREGDYSARVDLKLRNEFADLQNTFNDMAGKIEEETALRLQSEQARRRLILDVSHDLKNPLTSTAGYAELCLARGDMTREEQAGYLKVIHKNSKRAAALLTDLFELSKLESAEFALRIEKVDINEYLRQICGEILPEIERAGFGYEFDIPDEPVYGMLDAGQMDRVFQNLTDNALRYNPAGTLISVSLTERPDSVAIRFSDNGAGIDPSVADDIFKPFVRADSACNSATGGTGLGLSIARKIVEAHGGTLTLETGVNKGAKFAIILPRI